jgi:hypothetical protein
VHRKSMLLQSNEVITLQRYREKNANCYLSQVVVEIRFYGRNDETPNPFEVKQLAKAFKAFDGQYLTVKQLVLLEVFGTLFLVKVMQCQVVDINSLRGKSKELPVVQEASNGILSKRTEIRFVSPADGVCAVNMRGASDGGASSGLVRSDWSFESMGIGGLDDGTVVCVCVCVCVCVPKCMYVYARVMLHLYARVHVCVRNYVIYVYALVY